MNRNFKRFWKAYNEYSKSDRNAIHNNRCIDFVIGNRNNYCKKYSTKIKIQLCKDYEELAWRLGSSKKMKMRIKHFSAFDPNTITPEMLDSLDLPENIKRNILNYRKAGGKFFTLNKSEKYTE
jgi:hypothetical protein